MSGLRVLQASALSFLPSAILTTILGRWLGTGILLLTTTTSLMVHHPACTTQWIEYLDHVMICSWIAYNAFVVTQVVLVLLETFVVWRLVLLTLALVVACAMGLVEVQRRRLDADDALRTTWHVYIHLGGGVGTLLLLCATVDATMLLL